MLLTGSIITAVLRNDKNLINAEQLFGNPVWQEITVSGNCWKERRACLSSNDVWQTCTAITTDLYYVCSNLHFCIVTVALRQSAGHSAFGYVNT